MNPRIYISLLILFVAMHSVNAQFNYISPLPGSRYHNPTTNIILKNGQYLDKASVSNKELLQITGSLSGNHSWTARLSDDGKSVIVKPIPAFAYGETVSITIHSKLKRTDGNHVNGTHFSFEIRQPITPEQAAAYEESRRTDFIESFGYDPLKKLEGLQFETPDSFPSFVINVNNNASPGRVFYCNQQEMDESDTNSFPTIIENDGTLVWARDQGIDGHDFKLQKNGYLSYYRYGYAWWRILDSNYNVIDSVQCGNGYELETNGHDVQMYADGHMLLMALNNQTIDMTAYGGQPNATVKGLIIQELDENRDVVFQWRSWDHFLFTDANQFTPLTNSNVDYVHGNAVERDTDGNIMISSRNMDEITKINRETGEVIWRMGGENNQFTFVNDNIPEHFRQQHDIRRLPNGNVTLLNNGNFLPVQISSAKEYHLDEVNKIATLIWYYEHPDVDGVKVFAKGSANAQRLPNGNTMISWGTITFDKGLPNMTEVDPDKNIVWEMTFDQSGQKTYRAFKFDWNPCSRVSAFTMKAAKKPGMIQLSWQPATGAISYLVNYRQVGSSTWITKNIKAPKIKLLGLMPGTAYEWNIKTICDKNPLLASAYSETKMFFTPQKVSDTQLESKTSIAVYPVPASDYMTISLAMPSANSTLMIQNMVGQLVYERQLEDSEEISMQVNVTSWPKGMYLVSVIGGDKTVTQRVVIE
ncbi:MAG: aryl-sulfate sulfotransferase [Chitinophagaceae bacterium]|nr:aryl-sulfate sulfotransferase [Chitinophagaceae bacterium]